MCGFFVYKFSNFFYAFLLICQVVKSKHILCIISILTTNKLNNKSISRAKQKKASIDFHTMQTVVTFNTLENFWFQYFELISFKMFTIAF